MTRYVLVKNETVVELRTYSPALNLAEVKTQDGRPISPGFAAENGVEYGFVICHVMSRSG